MMYNDGQENQKGSGQPRLSQPQEMFCEWYATRAAGKVGKLVPDEILRKVFQAWHTTGDCVGLVVFPSGDQQMVGTGSEFSLREWKEVVGREEFLKTGVGVKWQTPQEILWKQ